MRHDLIRLPFIPAVPLKAGQGIQAKANNAPTGQEYMIDPIDKMLKT
jgi:hypothetical protein